MLEAFQERKGSQKGAKDARDIVKIVIGMSERDVLIASPYMTEKRVSLLSMVANSSAFKEITQNNSHESKWMRNQFDDRVSALASGEDPSSCSFKRARP